MKTGVQAAAAGNSAQVVVALLLSLLLHSPLLTGLERLRAGGATTAIRIDGQFVAATASDDVPPVAPALRHEPALPPVAADAPRRRQAPPGVPLPLLTARDAGTAGAGRQEFAVTPPVIGEGPAVLPFATAPGSVAAPDDVARQQPDDAVDAASQLAAFGTGLSSRVAFHQRYPPLAAARGWQGRVVLILHFAAGGRLVDVLIGASSGHAILDQEAIAMARRANPELMVPPSLQRRRFAVELPVDFKLSSP